MPGRDGTGPEGKGPRTGRGLGNCQSTTQSTSTIESQPCGQGRGLPPCGGGYRGRRRSRW